MAINKCRKAPSIVLSTLSGLLLCYPNVEAQIVTRADLLVAERQAKVEELQPPQRTTVERGTRALEKGLTHFETIKGRDPGWHYRTGDLPSGSGFGFGLGYTYKAMTEGGYTDPDRPNQIDFKAGGAYSTRDYYELKTEVQWRNIGASIVNLGWRAKYHEDPEEDFFGTGPKSERKARTNYLYRALEGTTDIWLAPIKGFRAGGSASYIAPGVGSGRDPRYASLERVFDPSTIPGFQGDQPDFLRVEAFLDYDRRDNPLYPRAGTFVGATLSNYSGRGNDQFSFRRVDLDAQQYIPFDDGYKVLALRSNVALTDNDANNSVPFYFMPELGGPQRLRGFREHRFRDRNSILVTAEYRWEAWWALDMALFADAGKVTASRSDINLKHLEGTYGIGFRFHTKKAFTFRMDIARSREGFVPIFRAEHVF